MYLRKADYNRKYPKHVEIAGDWNSANHVLEIAEGRFFPLDFGYVLLASVSSINGFTKTEHFSPGCLMSLEVHRDKYTSNVLDAASQKWVDKEIDPSQLERLLCAWLDKGRKLENNLVEKNWSAKFNLSDSAVIITMIEGSMEGDCSILFTDLKYVEPNLVKETPKASTTGFSKGGGGYTEKQKAEQRMEFLFQQVNDYFQLESDNPGKVKNIAGLASLMVNLAVSDYLSFLVFHSFVSLALGIPILPPTDLGIPFRSARAVEDPSVTPF